MIYGPKEYKEWYYSQDNNACEKLLGKLETCGPTAAVNCLAALGYNLEVLVPGSAKMQPEDVLTLFMNDPKNKKDFEKVRQGVWKIPGNRIPQFYPYAVQQVFNAKAEFMWLHRWDRIRDYIKINKTIQLCFKKPGHYIAVVAYDDETDEMIYNDPWAAHRKNKHGGHLERLTKHEFETNTANYCIIYS